MKDAVAAAIERFRSAFPSSEIMLREDGEGGVYVILEGIPLSGGGADHTWVGFHLTFQYPYADVYPHYVRPDLARRDGSALVGSGIHRDQTFEGRRALMLSRRSNRLNPQTDTALVKLEKVIAWLEGLR